jgi:hypothetical protein
MRVFSFLLPAALGVMVASVSAAADFDGARPFLCSTVDISSCVVGHDCTRESTETVNAPSFFIVDVANKLVSEAGPAKTGRTSKIDRVEHESGQLMLSGIDGDQGWSVSIGESNGKLTFETIRDGEGTVAFGSCVNQSEQ